MQQQQELTPPPRIQITPPPRFKKPKKCRMCPKRFRTSSELQQHSQQEHSLASLAGLERVYLPREGQIQQHEQQIQQQQQHQHLRAAGLDTSIKLQADALATLVRSLPAEEAAAAAARLCHCK